MFTKTTLSNLLTGDRFSPLLLFVRLVACAWLYRFIWTHLT